MVPRLLLVSGWWLGAGLLRPAVVFARWFVVIHHISGIAVSDSLSDSESGWLRTTLPFGFSFVEGISFKRSSQGAEIACPVV